MIVDKSVFQSHISHISEKPPHRTSVTVTKKSMDDSDEKTYDNFDFNEHIPLVFYEVRTRH